MLKVLAGYFILVYLVWVYGLVVVVNEKVNLEDRTNICVCNLGHNVLMSINQPHMHNIKCVRVISTNKMYTFLQFYITHICISCVGVTHAAVRVCMFNAVYLLMS